MVRQREDLEDFGSTPVHQVVGKPNDHKLTDPRLGSRRTRLRELGHDLGGMPDRFYKSTPEP